jgi:hypothetical protein
VGSDRAHDAANIGDEPGRILIIYPRHSRRAGTAGAEREGTTS